MKRVLTATERERNEQRMKEWKAQKRDAIKHGLNVQGLDRKISEATKVLEDGASIRYSTASQKDKAAARAKELEAKIKEGMLTYDEMHSGRGVSRGLKWERENKARIAELKNIKRSLSPDDPEAGKSKILGK